MKPGLILFAFAAWTQTPDEKIARAAVSLREKLIETRRDFHMHPELSNREERTARIVAERLRALGLDEVKTGVARHGVVALLRGAKPGKVVAVRADMDALPVAETNDVPYKSRNLGVKHACGHDVHTAVQLGVAEVLSKMRGDLAGTVKFIFQPAEEGPPPGEEGGAPMMVRAGVLENPRPEAIFGLHVNSSYRVGQLGWTPGPILASSDTFALTIAGRSVHGAYPHRGIDAVVVAAEAIQALQTIRSRRIIASEPMVLTVGKIQGGVRHNITAGEVRMDGTLRTLNENVREQAKGFMKTILTGVTQAHGATFRLEWDGDGNPVTHNDPRLAEAVAPSLGRAGALVRVTPEMGAEDFSAYQKVIPGFFFWLGVANPERGITASMHTPDFDVDEDSLVIGVRAMSTLVVDFLHGSR
ncbi:MAG: M20 metallopeptidase family protein [Bryobacteraceae bacterium]